MDQWRRKHNLQKKYKHERNKHVRIGREEMKNHEKTFQEQEEEEINATCVS